MARLAEPNATRDDIINLLKKEFGDDYAGCNPEDLFPESDLKITFGFENYGVPWSEYESCRKDTGWYEINGTTVALCWAGGDWEKPVWFAVYVERGGKRLRVYVPTVGNCFDIYCKTALGSQGEWGVDPEEVWPPDLTNSEDRVDDWEDYLVEHINVDDMLRDIGARIEGASPVVPFKKKHGLKYDAKALDEWIEQGKPGRERDDDV